MKTIFFCITILLLFFASCTNDIEWENAQTENSIESYLEYLTEKPDGEFINIAKFKIDSLLTVKDENDWQIAKGLNTSDSYSKYIQENLTGTYIPEAQILWSERKGAEVWDEVVKTGTFDAYQNYLEEFPESKYADLAREKLSQFGK